MSNLRILHDNVADRAELYATSMGGLLPVDNLKSNKKTKVWRTDAPYSADITANWELAQEINCVILAFTNISEGASIYLTLVGANSSPVYSMSITLDEKPGNYIVLYLPAIYFANMVDIYIEDTNNTSGYLEASRLIIGKFWSPRFNTGFGMTVALEDSSTVDRTDSGDLILVKGTKGRKISFELPWMNYQDRDSFNSLINTNGKYIPVFASLFPNSEDKSKESLYEIFGSLAQDTTLTHTMHTMYSGRLEITEI